MQYIFYTSKLTKMLSVLRSVFKPSIMAIFILCKTRGKVAGGKNSYLKTQNACNNSTNVKVNGKIMTTKCFSLFLNFKFSLC